MERTDVEQLFIRQDFAALRVMPTGQIKEALQQPQKESECSTVGEALLEMLLCGKNKRFQAAKMLMELYGVSPNALHSSGATLLNLYLVTPKEDLCRFLLENGADPNFCAPLQALTPFELVYLYHGENLVLTARLAALLLEFGARTDSVLEKSQRTPLTLACEYGDSETVRQLLKLGADPTQRDGYHLTPSQWWYLGCLQSRTFRARPIPTLPVMDAADRDIATFYGALLQIMLHKRQAEVRFFSVSAHLSLTETERFLDNWVEDRFPETDNGKGLAGFQFLHPTDLDSQEAWETIALRIYPVVMDLRTQKYPATPQNPVLLERLVQACNEAVLPLVFLQQKGVSFPAFLQVK